MKRFPAMILVAALLVLCLSGAMAEGKAKVDEDWEWIGYIYGGVTFAVPTSYEFFEVSASDAARGCVLMGGNADFTLQMRAFAPDELSYADFKLIVEQEPTAETETRTDGDSEILLYRNTQPDAYSELYGIAMTGLDGMLYKISIFTGDDNSFESDAPVWEIAEAIGQSAKHQDFSSLGVEGAPNFSSANSDA